MNLVTSKRCCQISRCQICQIQRFFWNPKILKASGKFRWLRYHYRSVSKKLVAHHLSVSPIIIHLSICLSHAYIYFPAGWPSSDDAAECPLRHATQRSAPRPHSSCISICILCIGLCSFVYFVVCLDCRNISSLVCTVYLSSLSLEVNLANKSDESGNI